MHAFSGKGVEEHRKRSHKGLTLTGSHLGDHAALLLVGFDAAIEDDTADKLHVIMHHIPGNLVAAGLPMVVPDGFNGSVIADLTGNLHEIPAFGSELLVKFTGRHLDGFAGGETAGRALDDGKSLGEDLVQDHLDGVVLILHQLVAFAGKGLFLGNGDIFFEFQFNLRYSIFKRLFHGGDLRLERLGAGTEGVVGKCVDFRVNFQDLVQDGPDGFHIPVRLGSENSFQYICDCHK